MFFLFFYEFLSVKRLGNMIKEKTEKKIYKAVITKKEKVSKACWFIEADCGHKVQVKAGQFVSIYCEGLTLRRPFSVFSNQNGKIGILFKERGKGTEYIKSLAIGDFIDIAGPFGNGFSIENKKSLLIGAGIGSAPISFLKTQLEANGIENKFICGFLTETEIPAQIQADKIYTDDGSFGEKGSVIKNLETIIQTYNPQIIYACGPKGVLKIIAEAGKKYNIETQIAMEKVMACGIGVCRGCVIEVTDGNTIKNKSVCKDGPVFKGSEVIW